MTKFLIGLFSIAGLVYLIAHDSWKITLETADYQISVSFILFVTALLFLWWLLGILRKPFSWWGKFKSWRQAKNQIQKDKFLTTLLTAFLSHNKEQVSSLIKEAQKIYGSDSHEALLTSALLTSDNKAFNLLNQNESTKMAGLYGLIKAAEENGDFEEIDSLLKQVPKSQEKALWIQQLRLKLALERNDWQQALSLLEENKKQFSKSVYKSHKACLLVKLGQLKKAYHTMPGHPAIAMMYAKVTPKKARAIIEKLWYTAPSWQVYLAYKEAIQYLSADKRLKAILALTRSTRDQRYSLLARADMDMELHNWARAKENLEIYLKSYPLTRQVADMMAHLERTAWHHESLANEWERKAVESEDDSLWRCRECNHTTGEWQILCPHCNGFDSLYNQ